MSKSIVIPTFTDESFGVTVDPTGWRTHPLWCALCNYLDLLDSRYSKIARIMVDNILAIMQADFMCDARESNSSATLSTIASAFCANTRRWRIVQSHSSYSAAAIR